MFGMHYITPEVGAYMIAFCLSFPPGFILSRYIVFPESNLHGRIQFFRYALTTITFILMSYILVRVFAFYMPKHATIAYTFVCIITAVCSYISQKAFTFKTVSEKVATD
jgi:putative flippase GtrA